jgi:transcriptional regulator with XRE-family HTH domain
VYSLQKDYDHIELGRKIRTIRKSKDISLTDLAKGLFSIGKMSNIENGKTNIRPEEISAISKKLGVTIDDLLITEESKRQSELLDKLKFIESLIYLKQYKVSNVELQTFYKEHHDELNSSSVILYHLLVGEVKFHLQEYHASSSYLYQALENQINKGVSIRYRSRAHQLICLIHKHFGDLPSAFEHMELAYFELLSNNMEVNWRIYLNLSVLSFLQNNTLKAKSYIDQIKRADVQNNGEILCFRAVLDFFSGLPEQSINTLLNIRNILFEDRDLVSFLKCNLALLYFADVTPIISAEKLENTTSWIEVYAEQIETEDPLLHKFTMKYLHLLILRSIKIGDSTKAQELIMKVKHLENQVPPDEPFLTLLLESLYLKKFNPNNISSRSKKLEEVIDLLRSVNPSSNYYGIALYELATIKEKHSDSFYAQAAKQFMKQIRLDSLDYIDLEDIAPEVTYR